MKTVAGLYRNLVKVKQVNIAQELGKKIQYLFVLEVFLEVQIKYLFCSIADGILKYLPCFYNALMKVVVFLSSLLVVYHPLRR